MADATKAAAHDGTSRASRALTGKIALVTGAGRGIGRAIAQRFVDEGAYVLAVGRSESVEELASHHSHIDALRADVSTTDGWQSIIDAYRAKWGRLDVLVNNAAVSGSYANIGDTSVEDFDEVFAIQVRGTYLGMRYVIPPMVASGGGIVVNIGSTSTYVVEPGMAAYCAAKAAIAQLSRSAAAEYGRDGVRVNTLCPGMIETPMINEFRTAQPDAFAALLRRYPLGRIGGLSEIADAAVFLAGDQSSFVTGASLVVDGGFLCS
jgi:NAD(P)-dependent dehydrogenase (short-subunit alcohol dehydrogenase family)